MNSPPFSRALIPGDRELPPFEFVGFERPLVYAIYSGIVVTSLAGLAYVFYENPLFALVALAFGYYFDNLMFVYGHMEFHTEFIEIPEAKMKTLCHNSYIHHYRNTRIFHERWLESRISYFFEAKSLLGPKSVAKIALGLAGIFAFAYYVDPLLGIAWYSAQVVPSLLQSTVHEWYHNPPGNRKTFYSFPVYWFFTVLEKTKLASTKRHTIHHQHGLNNLAHVDNWLDLYIPFGEMWGERLWRKALSLYEPGKTRMNDFALQFGIFKLLLARRALATAAIAAAFFLIVR